MPLSDTDRSKLDSIVQQMHANGEQDSDVQSVVNDFKSKYGGTQTPVESIVNYRTGNNLIDAPMGVAQGAIKGLAGTAYGAVNLANKIPGVNIPINQQAANSITTPNGVGQGTGKFLEQAAEYAVPAGEVSGALRGAGALARIGGQAAVGGAVGAVQSGGDPMAAATGAVMGAGGEALGQAAKGVLGMYNKVKPPTLQNYIDAFGAVPTQKGVVGKALPILTRDGIMPGENPAEMQGAIHGKLADLGSQYQALDPAIGDRGMDPKPILDKLMAQRDAYSRNGVISKPNAASWDKINGEIETIQDLVKAHSQGQLTFNDLKYLRDGANDATKDWAAGGANKDLYRSAGDTYRWGMDQLAPETTQLNKDYALYKRIGAIADKNVDMGRGGLTKSGLAQVLDDASKKTVGAGMGYAAGAATGIPGAGPLGALVGGVAYPKLAGATVKALQNAADSGSFSAMSAARRQALSVAAKMGDNSAVMKMLGVAPAQAAASSAFAQ